MGSLDAYVDSTFILMNFMNEDLIDLIHNIVGFLTAHLLDKRGEALHVAKHYSNKSMLPFNFALLENNFFGQSFRKVSLYFFNLPIKRNCFRCQLSMRDEFVAALATEFVGGRVLETAARADSIKL